MSRSSMATAAGTFLTKTLSSSSCACSDAVCATKVRFTSKRLFRTLSLGDVTGNSRNAHGSTTCILNWGDSQGYIDFLSGFGNTNGFKVLDTPPGLQRFKNLVLLIF